MHRRTCALASAGALLRDSLARGKHPLQGTDGSSEAGHHSFQSNSVEVLVLNTQRVCQVSILLLYYCKFHSRGLQSLADLTFCSHVLSLTCDPSAPPEPSHAVTVARWRTWCMLEASLYPHELACGASLHDFFTADL